MLTNEKIISKDELKLLLQQAYVEGYEQAKKGDCDYYESGWQVAHSILEKENADSKKI